jgi:hypothetical protein
VRGLLAVLLLAPALAHADDEPEPPLCDDPIVDPPAVGLRAGNFDAPRSACLRSELEVRVDTRALIDTPGFHGTLGGDLQVGLRTLEDFGLEWGVTLQFVDYTFAQTAVVTATDATYGPFSLHGALGRDLTDRVKVAGYLRFEVPFTRSLLDVTMGGTQVAALATWDAHPWIAVHGRGGALLWYASSQGGFTGRAAGVLSADGAVRVNRWLETMAGLELQAGWYRSGVDHFAGRLGAHWRVKGPWRVEVAALVPLAGEERTNVALTIAIKQDR